MSFLVMVPKDESGFVSKFADLTGLNGIEPKQRFELLPYLVQKAQYLRHDKNDPFYAENQYQTSFGGDFKASIGSNLNLDVTVNPALQVTILDADFDSGEDGFSYSDDAFRGTAEPDPESGRLLFLASIIGLLIAYYFAIGFIGYFVSSFLFLVIVMHLLAYEKKRTIYIVAGGWVLFSYVIFYKALYIQLPLGRLFENYF